MNLCKCCYARLPEEECETCRMAGCDASLDSVQCRPDGELDCPGCIDCTSDPALAHVERCYYRRPNLMSALEWALLEGRYEDAADLYDPNRKEPNR